MNFKEEIDKTISHLEELKAQLQEHLGGEYYGFDLPLEKKVDARLAALSMGFELDYLKTLLKGEGDSEV